MTLPSLKEAWEAWARVARDGAHLHFELEGGSIESHIAFCVRVGDRSAERVAEHVQGIPARILEVGASVGFNCAGLARHYPNAQVVGIEPDPAACAAANAMATELGLNGRMEVLNGFGEQLPFPSERFDLIVCNTVIEHVNDVDRCIAEMARVLKPGGTLRLEAPNYLWPHEPHLGIVTLPLCPKPLLRLLARVQGEGRHVSYLNHLKLVHPAWIERAFSRNGLEYENLSVLKLRRIAEGDANSVVSYHRFAKGLRMLNTMRLAAPLVSLADKLRLYPSLLYAARKPITHA